jgi:hypothetical protein
MVRKLIKSAFQRIQPHTRNRCFRIQVADKELAGAAFNGFLSYLRDILDGESRLEGGVNRQI